MYGFKSVLFGAAALASCVAAQGSLFFKQTPPQAVVGTTYIITYSATSPAVC